MTRWTGLLTQVRDESPAMGPLSGPLGSHESPPVLWLDGVCNQIRRLSHRVEADEPSDLVCYSLDRVVERKARVPRSHVVRKRAAMRIHRAKGVPPCRVPVLENISPVLDEGRILKAHVASDHRRDV